MSGGGDASHSIDLPRGLIGRKGTPSGRAARLPSLRGPRDLTLGGVPKKTFTPNIPARRDKPKDGEQSASTSRSRIKFATDLSKTFNKEGKSTEKSSRGRGRGRGRGADNIVQSHSIFEQGPTERLNVRPGGFGGYDKSDAPHPVSKTSSQRTKEPDEKISEIIENLLRDDFVAIQREETDPTMTPIILPLSASSGPSSATKKEMKVDSDTPIIKTEPDDDTDMPDAELAAELAVEQNEKKPENFHRFRQSELTCQDLFTKCGTLIDGEQMFFQLPDVLPGQPPCREKNKKDSTTESKAGSEKKADQEEKLTKKMQTCCLTDFSEGYVGKLQVRKSGKTQLVLGNVTLDIAMGAPCGFLQDLVSVRLGDGDGSLAVLGHITQRLVCSPDFETLLEKT